MEEVLEKQKSHAENLLQEAISACERHRGKEYSPYSRDRVLEAVRFAEDIATILCILAERTRTQLNSEAPEGMEWRLVKK